MDSYEDKLRDFTDSLFDCPTPYFTKEDLVYNLNKKFIVKDIDILINGLVEYGVLKKDGDLYKIALEDMLKKTLIKEKREDNK